MGITATGGTLNVNETVTSAGAGTITLTATGATSDVVVATGKSVTSTGGNIAINAPKDITLTGTGAVITSGTGTITLTADSDNATSGAISANNSTTAIQAGSGLVTLLARSGIAAGTTIDNVTATNTATGNIVIADTAGGLTISTGGINQFTGGTVDVSSAGTLTIATDVTTGRGGVDRDPVWQRRGELHRKKESAATVVAAEQSHPLRAGSQRRGQVIINLAYGGVEICLRIALKSAAQGQRTVFERIAVAVFALFQVEITAHEGRVRLIDAGEHSNVASQLVKRSQ